MERIILGHVTINRQQAGSLLRIYKGNATDPLSLNLYAYCGNNPIKYVDKSGHERVDSDWSVLYKTEEGKLATQNMTQVKFTNLDTVLYTMDGTFFHTSGYELAMGHHAYMLDPDNLMDLPDWYAWCIIYQKGRQAYCLYRRRPAYATRRLYKQLSRRPAPLKYSKTAAKDQ